ncbi:sortase [Candidatus Dojkabacteria bacterium]|nr:sortase [Candidatus Dojkabacteria bacterium]
MTLYYYKKAPPKNKLVEKKVKKKPIKGITIASVLDKVSYRVSQKISSIKPVALILPFLFIFSGLSILYGQAKPFAVHLIQTKLTDNLNQEVIPLVPESYEKMRAQYISDPGSEYFSKLITEKKPSPQTIDYKGTFYLTIKKIKIYDAPVTSNVDSSNEETYKDALGKGLAHFKGTCLPGQDCNVLIYGHSAAGDYAEKNPQDVVTAFTRLFKLNIGDEITIKFQEQEYTYTVKKIKEVNPEDVDILSSNGTKTLTLMTCSPPGLSSKRLVVTAVQQ